MAGIPASIAGTGGVFSASSQQGIQVAAEEGLHVVHGRLHRLRDPARHRRADGPVAAVDRLRLPAGDGRPVRRHRRHEPHVRRRRVLRRRPARPGAVQRHGDRRGLDERRVVHRHGRNALPDRLRRPRVRHGLDRRLLPGRAVPGAVPAQVRPVHDSRLSRRALRRPHPADGRHLRRDPVLVHLRGGADLRRGPHHDAPDRRRRSSSAFSSASAASWCARSWAACAR